tara:strand:+ start:5732 stop:7552 length:1821 start_codon:yes stop_codon:yes gene_type:complete
MCGIFGSINVNDWKSVEAILEHARRRGRDSSGVVAYKKQQHYECVRADFDIKKLKQTELNLFKSSEVIFGHSRLITDGFFDNQPVITDNIFVIHNGIVTNADAIWKDYPHLTRKFTVDTEILNILTVEYLKLGQELEGLADFIFERAEGAISALVGIPSIGKIVLLSNNGSLFYSEKSGGYLISSEKYPLIAVGSQNITQIENSFEIFDIPLANEITIEDHHVARTNLIPQFDIIKSRRDLLVYPEVNVQRCTKCILPSTMPFITFNEEGVCNYCENYKVRNQPKPMKDLEKILEPYRKENGVECIVPFSGGRDSSFGLHLIVKELGLKAVAYTYDWGLVTDLGRRNISRVVSKLNVENIVVAADIEQKRRFVRKNVLAWLNRPSLGMISLFTAGDKHFFRYIERVKEELGITLNIWSVNPLEVTHFKAGFLGVAPDFQEERVYMSNFKKQIEYQKLRFSEMLKNPGYINNSLFDTLQGEYYRSFNKKSDYYHLFDFYKWNEDEIDSVLKSEYQWELASDTSTTWRIGDGTAAFYNYIYRTVAGFTEHDTFRSNQIREGDISREQAFKLVQKENEPRYQNLKWYLDLLDLDFQPVIEKINNIPRLY